MGIVKTCYLPPTLLSVGENTAYDAGSELTAGEEGLVNEGHSSPQSGWTGLRYVHWDGHAKNESVMNRYSAIWLTHDVTSKGRYRLPQLCAPEAACLKGVQVST